MLKRTTVSAFAKRKSQGEKIVMVTAYDAPTAAAAADGFPFSVILLILWFATVILESLPRFEEQAHGSAVKPRSAIIKLNRLLTPTQTAVLSINAV